MQRENIFKRIIHWFKYFGWGSKFPFNCLSAVFHPIKFIKCLRYPFVKVYHKWTGKFMGYSYTEDESIDYGWRKAFSKEMLKEIKQAGKVSRKRIGKHLSWKKMLMWEQIKEKYGTLRLYASATEEIENVLSKYEYLSRFYCINCGKPTKYITHGWIEYLCEDCFRKDLNRYNEMSEDELNKAMSDSNNILSRKNDITIFSVRNENGEWVDVDVEKKYNINLKELTRCWND